MSYGKPVPGFPRYTVTKAGDVWSHAQGPPRKLKPFLRGTGYAAVELWAGGVGRKVSVHHVVLSAFVSARHDGQVCRHMNGDRLDNRLSNLMWGSLEENAADKVRHDTVSCGERNGRSRLTESQVIEIRDLYDRGVASQRRLAADYGVGGMTIHYIVKRKTWTHLTHDPNCLG